MVFISFISKYILSDFFLNVNREFKLNVEKMSNYNPISLANRIRKITKSKNISIGKMLQDCELNRDFISVISTRGTFPKVNNLAKVADYLDCSIDYLLDRSDIIDCKKEISEKYSDQEILRKFKSLSDDDKEIILGLIDRLNRK